MVGVLAINIHGYNRSAAGIDLWINDIPSNRKFLAVALGDLLIAPAEIVERMQFVPGRIQMTLNNGFLVDIMTTSKGLECYTFGECHDLAVTPEMESEKSLSWISITYWSQKKQLITQKISWILYK